MITLVDDLKVLQSLPDCFETVKIMSLVSCYGLETEFLLLYKQTDENGALSSVIMRFYNELTVFSDGNLDLAELKEFIDFFGCGLFCKAELFESLKIKNFNRYCCMEFAGEAIEQKSENLKYEKIYEILKNANSKDIILPEFDDWYVDFCHRVRHKKSRSFSIDKSGVAITIFETENSAVIGGVATEINSRNRGIARKNILGICDVLQKENKKIFLLCSEELLKFYVNLGFKEIYKIGIKN